MPDDAVIKLSLLENSHAYLRESVSHALNAEDDPRKWQFAILNLVQSLELSVKSHLSDIHPILIYENIDAPKHTVSLSKAINRLKEPLISDMNFSEAEHKNLMKTIELRNQMVHSEFELRPEFAKSKYFITFAFIRHFQKHHFHYEMETIIGQNQFDELLKVKQAVEELAKKALQKIQEENIDEDCIWDCPNCFNETFVMSNEITQCYTCRHMNETVECPKCGEPFPESEIVDFSNLFEYDLDEGRAILVGTYDYDYCEACLECIKDINEDIEQKQLDDIHRFYDY